MADITHLYGSCACERNQYTIIVPSTAASSSTAQLAHVYFDNSLATLRTQAAPITAWLRVPLDWYQSFTVAHFPDETHSSIRKTFNIPLASSNPIGSGEQRQPSTGTTRKQFCGYCGTHLTAWREQGGNVGEATEYLDVTLGSLVGESLAKLEDLGILSDDSDEFEAGEENDEVSTAVGGAREDKDEPMENAGETYRQLRNIGGNGYTMSHRGMPYFEELVENSRLGRIRQRKGGHVSPEGNTVVQWEIVEIGSEDIPNEELATVSTSSPSSKRQKVI